MQVRNFRTGDEAALYEVFYSSVHQLAAPYYTQAQLDAWAPSTVDATAWAQRMQCIRPFVVENGNRILGYADVQHNGYIDHFYISGSYGRQGVGTRLMNRIHQAAESQGIKVLTSNVSGAAQPFFKTFGFVVVEEGAAIRHGIAIPNALMRKELNGLS